MLILKNGIKKLIYPSTLDFNLALSVIQIYKMGILQIKGVGVYVRLRIGKIPKVAGGFD